MQVRALAFAPPLVAALLIALWGGPPAMAAPAAPAITVRLLESGKTFDSRALLGKKALLVRFQASWCKVCAEELDDVQRVHDTYGPRDVQVIAIHVQDAEADARSFLRKAGATYPAGLDPKLRIANRFGFKGTPYTVVVDKKGEIAARIHGSATELRMRAALDPLLERRPPKKPPPKRLR
jgi:cytochrome c biogenesis protein CcmG, thiol:disulfide interchange protein DsbE